MHSVPGNPAGANDGSLKPRRAPVRYGIRVIFPNGAVGFLRHGPVAGHGPIVRFKSKREADANLYFIRDGLDEGCTANVFKILPGPNEGR